MKLMWATFLIWGTTLVAAEPGASLDAHKAPDSDNPKLPRVMIIGDSISVGYTDGVREELAGKANVYRVPGNAGPSSSGVQHVDEWIAFGNGHWDVVHFNFGLHDLKLGTGGKDNRPYPSADGHQVPLDEYERNLRQIVAKLKRTGAKLIWCSTTPIPQGKLDPLRHPGDEVTYNLEKDTSEFGLPVPEEFAELLKIDAEGNEIFMSLTPGKQRTLLYMVSTPKSIDLRIKRAICIIDHLKATNGKINYRQLNELIKNSS